MVIFKVNLKTKNLEDSIKVTKEWEDRIRKFNGNSKYENYWIPDFINVETWDCEMSVCKVYGCSELANKPDKVIERLKELADVFDKEINNDRSSIYLPEEIEYVKYKEYDREPTKNKFESTPTVIFRVHNTASLPVGIAFDYINRIKEMYDGIDFSKPTKLWIPDDLMDVEFIETKCKSVSVKNTKSTFDDNVYTLTGTVTV